MCSSWRVKKPASHKQGHGSRADTAAVLFSEDQRQQRASASERRQLHPHVAVGLRKRAVSAPTSTVFYYETAAMAVPLKSCCFKRTACLQTGTPSIRSRVPLEPVC